MGHACCNAAQPYHGAFADVCMARSFNPIKVLRFAAVVQIILPLKGNHVSLFGRSVQADAVSVDVGCAL